MTGERFAAVYSGTATKFHDLTVEDVGFRSMVLIDGTQFTLDGSWGRPENWECWGNATMRLVGTEATVDTDCFTQTLEHASVTSNGGGREAVCWGADPDVSLPDDFVDAVLMDLEPEITDREGVESVAVVSAACESAAGAAPVAVDY